MLIFNYEIDANKPAIIGDFALPCQSARPHVEELRLVFVG